MLVLSRKPQQQIQIGDDVTITILKIKGNSVSIGIEAPREIHIVRGELPREPQPARVTSEATVVLEDVEGERSTGDSRRVVSRRPILPGGTFRLSSDILGTAKPR